ncbi:acyl-CoA dehydratase activase [Bacillota bacterium LX-D]|nr:acyl-CoA dehydratase activase [Bacillota bacterium LX-D]
MYTAGLCVGASNVSLVVLERGAKITIKGTYKFSHDGNPKETIAKILNYCPENLQRIAVTGRKFKDFLNLSTISEPEATEYAYEYLHLGKEYDAVVSAGGETFIIYLLSRGRIINVWTGNKCASGTGEFFLQQVNRMGLSVEEAVQMAKNAEIYQVAGRCSVFCKSDCTHALNKGEPKAKVIAGLSQMMGAKILDLVHLAKAKSVVLVGGTTANLSMLNFLQKEIGDLYIPAEAQYFEALGAALWAKDHETITLDRNNLFKLEGQSFAFLPPLSNHQEKVAFKSWPQASAQPGDVCIVGLDVGSTTTKAVVIRLEDAEILAKVYLRTNGDPVKAARQCYVGLNQQVPDNLKIIAIGVTGSGRQIAGLHALTEGVINEIIAHAKAAVFFDPEVDTILEIGGQDAKYTYLENGVPCDYAMNEACSAGTGSFLEEAAKESLQIKTTEIGTAAIKAMNPPNFSDQCAAFIASDIKNAIHSGINNGDIAAGLVYSICQNYINRVKGTRPTGKKIFMQGGVCYNQAVPLAMAGLLGKEIVVPPEPGLMGAFGVALEIKSKLELGLLQPSNYNLKELAEREVIYRQGFTCRGKKENCDRKCYISMLEVAGTKYPFGGACNKYENYLHHKVKEWKDLDLVALREKLLYSFCVNNNTSGLKIGISKSFFSNTYLPLYHNFFTNLGCQVVLPLDCLQEGKDMKGAAFCYPAEQAHGYCYSLTQQTVDYYFLPQVKGVAPKLLNYDSVTCPFVQGEPYYLQNTFPEIKTKMLNPVFDFTKPWEDVLEEFVQIGIKLGFDRKSVLDAVQKAWQMQQQFWQATKKEGEKFLAELAKNPDHIGIVLFGRPYNAFTKNANMGIPAKFASRGYKIIPCDFLPLDYENSEEQMYWSVGQMLLKSGRFVQGHPQLFTAYITNFSCGPDSFLLNYVREILGKKPSLTLELDSHTADAGIDTRIEAFLDVIKSYRQNNNLNRDVKVDEDKAVTQIRKADKIMLRTIGGEYFSLKDEGVKVLFPTMGTYSAQALAATFRYFGINAQCLEAPGTRELSEAKKYFSCKECMPLLLTAGSLKKYLNRPEASEEIIVFFMPTTSGPCRFGQYHVAIEHMLKKENITNVALFSLSSANGYAGLPTSFMLRAWRCAVIGDVLDDIRNALMVLAKDQTQAFLVLDKAVESILAALEQKNWNQVVRTLEEAVAKLAAIPLKQKIQEVSKVLLVGEIYVRKDGFSRQSLEEKLAEKGIILKIAPIAEWVYYCDYLFKNSLTQQATWLTKAKINLKLIIQRKEEQKIKAIFAKSNLYTPDQINIEKYIQNAADAIAPTLTGEAILTVGEAVTEMIAEVDGVIAIGPFGCLPNRMAEAILNKGLHRLKANSAQDDLTKQILERYPALPFLALESDGNQFPQLIEAKIEAFCLQVKRLAKWTQANRIS